MSILNQQCYDWSQATKFMHTCCHGVSECVGFNVPLDTL